MNVLITGAAGFIGCHVCLRLLSKNIKVVGIDNLNDYYSVELKKYRLNKLRRFKNFKFIRADLSGKKSFESLINNNNIITICHLAAQAGVRYSITNPSIYLKYNIDGFLKILEYCRKYNTNLVYASSSSVYGANKKVPFSVHDDVSKPVSLYAATKRSNELMAESYFHLYNLNSIGLRFFTVYGPMGRPDMAIWKFTDSIINDKPIEVYNRGKLSRDFTYIDDIIDGVVNAIKLAKNKKFNKHEIYNLGNNSPVVLNTLIKLLEDIIGKKAKKKLVSMQLGDVKKTFADIEKSKRELRFQPKTSLRQGLLNFVNWYKEYNKI